ncbi:MAG: bifunctional homocysteine S-methyltransferase/methylenetetrahydrofolate reductase [Chloroflexi bacterium]|nr:bifunctional homocysteine S-methyltransferase/methylenetetrahydrofolate reductase [Chloroflexota bacterium]
MDARAHPFLAALEQGVVLADGATGTALRALGWRGRNDTAVLERPELSRTLHEAYIAAGARLILTNTFAANRARLSLDGLGSRVRDANVAAARLARDAREIAGADVFIGGSVGPIGRDLLVGTWTLDDAERAFEEQVSALVEGGVDVLVLESMPSLAEAEAALRAVQRVTADHPTIVTLDFNVDTSSPAGEGAREIARRLDAAGPDVIGVNCGVGPQAALDMLQAMAGTQPRARLAVQPNAGLPRVADGQTIYPARPEYFADFALRARDLGAAVVGGCCGTTDEHVRAMRDALGRATAGLERRARVRFAGDPQIDPPALDEPDPRSGGVGRGSLRDALAGGRFVVAVEIDPPRGINPRKAIEGAAALAAAGADAINIGDSPMARVRMSALSLAVQIEREVGIETIVHQTTRDRNLMALQSDMLGAHALGIRTVLALTGDPPPEASRSSRVWDVDSIEFIRVLRRLNEGIDFAGNSIGRPTDFLVAAAANPTAEDVDRELSRVRAKVEAGAQLLMTQPVYEVGTLLRFFERLGVDDVPVLAGVLPLMSSRHAEFIHNELAGVDVPAAVRQRMRDAGEAGADAGLALAREHVEELRAVPWMSGIYVMPSFGRYEIAAELVRAAAVARG